MQTEPTIFDQLPYIVRLGLNIQVARRHYADPPMTQGGLASRLGRSQNYISRIERGLTYPTIPELEEIARLTGLGVADIKPDYRGLTVSTR